MQRGNVVATFDCEVSPDELETLCFQPSGFSVRTTVTYCDPYSQERGRNGLFVGGDPINYFDPTGLIQVPLNPNAPRTDRYLKYVFAAEAAPVAIFFAPEIAAGAGVAYETAGAATTTVLANPFAQKFILGALVTATVAEGPFDQELEHVGETGEVLAQSLEQFGEEQAGNLSKLGQIMSEEYKLIQQEFENMPDQPTKSKKPCGN